MEFRKLNVVTRTELGSRATMQLRGKGFIPGVIYAGGKEAVSLSINAHDYTVATKGADQTQIYHLESSEKELDGMMAMVKDVQKEPLANKTLHIDLLELTKGQRLSLTITVRVVGECPAVKQNAAIITQSVYELEIECLPKEIPDALEADISVLAEGEGLHARDIPLPDGVTLKSDPGQSIISIVAQKAEEVAAPAEEGVGETPVAEADAEPAAE